MFVTKVHRRRCTFVTNLHYYERDTGERGIHPIREPWRRLDLYTALRASDKASRVAPDQPARLCCPRIWVTRPGVTRSTPAISRIEYPAAAMRSAASAARL